jgi:hypothetical protein
MTSRDGRRLGHAPPFDVAARLIVTLQGPLVPGDVDPDHLEGALAAHRAGFDRLRAKLPLQLGDPGFEEFDPKNLSWALH